MLHTEWMSDYMKPDVVIFDLDGVILDTADVVTFAYIESGVNPPDDILAQEGSSWLADQVGVDQVDEVKKHKASVYQALISMGAAQTLPPFSVAQRLAAHGQHCMILSGAPAGTIDIVKQLIGVKYWPFTAGFDNMKTPIKMLFMRKLLLRNKIGVYIDDQNRFIDTPVGWRFIQYTGQDEDTLFEEIVK